MKDEDTRRSISPAYAIYTLFHFIIVDTVVYGCLIPLLGTYIAGGIACNFGIPPRWELVATVAVTFALIYGTFCAFGEVSYWKHLFAFESFYLHLLRARDVLNAFISMIVIVSLASTVENMVNIDKGIKKTYVSEGASYVLFKTVLEYLSVKPEVVLVPLGFKPPHTGGFTDPSFGENEKFEHGAAFMLLWAMLTGCVVKFVYYNTLFTYIRSMEIFMTMNPIFDDDDDSIDGSRFTLRTHGRTPSRMDRDFSHSMRRGNHEEHR